MPEIGEIRKGREIGKEATRSFIWVACDQCGDERWTRLYFKKDYFLLCKRCGIKNNIPRMEKHPNWKGGYKKEGYFVVTLKPNSPYISMASKKDRSIKEHRLIMAQHLGRMLLPSEVVHHINGIKDDNRIENLELYSPGKHTKMGNLCRHCELRKEIRLLRWQVKELASALQLKITTEPQATIATNLEVE